MSYPISSPDSGSALLPLLRPQPAVGEKREGEGDEGGATGGEREAKSKVNQGLYIILPSHVCSCRSQKGMSHKQP